MIANWLYSFSSFSCHFHVQTRVNQRQSFNIPLLLCLKTVNIPKTVNSIWAQARSVNRTSPGVWLKNKILLLHCSHIPERPCLYRCESTAYLRSRSLAETLRWSKHLMQEQRHLFGSVATQSTNLHLLAVWTFSVTSGTRTLRTAIPLTFSLLSWLPILLPPLCFPPEHVLS